MRILMLAQFYPPAIGGEERHVRNLSMALVERGHEVSLATIWHEGLAEFEIDQGIRVYRIRSLVQRAVFLFRETSYLFAPPCADPHALWAIRQIIQQERPEIVHAHNWLVHSFTPLKVWSKARLVVTLHDYSLVCAQKRLICGSHVCSGPVLGKCLRCATDFYGPLKGPPVALAHRLWRGIEERAVDMFLPVSRAVAEGTRLEETAVPYQIIPNFIPDNVSDLHNDAHPLLAQLPKEPYVLFVGDIKRDKGIEVLLEAFQRIGSPLPLVLIGRLYYSPPAGFPAHVVVLQEWPHEAVMSAWRRCTIGLVPSIWSDPCPTVAMEAMSMGRPLIASRIGGLKDIVRDGETGLLVPPGDPAALGHAIQVLLADPLRREMLGRCARERVVHFQAQTIVPRIEQVYQRLLTPPKTMIPIKPLSEKEV